MINLRRGLIEPRRPGHLARIVRASVASDDRALITGYDHRVRIRRIDPRLVIIIAAGRSAQHDPRFSTIPRSVHRDVGNVDSVGIGWIHSDLLEVPTPSPQRWVVGDSGPRRTGIVGTKESALSRRRARRTRARRRGLRD